MVETLSYECSPRPFFVPPSLHGYRGRVGGLDVIEHRHRSKVLPYGLRMECQVMTREQAAHHADEARRLARDLNAVWAYVAIIPLFPKHFMLRLSGPPDGLSTNFEQLKSTRPIKPRSTLAAPGPAVSFRASIKLNKHVYEVRLPYMPLRRALSGLPVRTL